MQDSTPHSRPGRDLYAEVTNRIIEVLERGAAPWVRPWRVLGARGGLRNAVSGHEYSGINVMLLGMTLDARGFENPRWVTYQQAQALGGQVRRGEHGTLVVFWKPLKVRDREASADAQERTIPLLRHYTVFNVGQCEGLGIDPIVETVISEGARNLGCDDFVAGTGAVIRHGGSRACYRLRPHDDIEMPVRSAFIDAGAYYPTLLHELIHWTGDESRSPRPFGRRFGDPDYAREESWRRWARPSSASSCKWTERCSTRSTCGPGSTCSRRTSAPCSRLRARRDRRAPSSLLREPETAPF